MPNFQIFSYPSDLQIIVKQLPLRNELSEEINQEIEKIWEKELKRSEGKLFNGQLFSLISWKEQQLMGSFVDYKLYLAQLRQPQLATLLNIKPLAISGLTRSEDRFLVAQRSSTVLDPLLYELAPSGGIDPRSVVGDRIDIKKQFILELEEETGLLPETVQHIRPFALIRDSISQITEICAEITIDSQAVNVNPPIGEYVEFFWILETDLADFIAKYRHKFVPLSLYMLKEKYGIV